MRTHGKLLYKSWLTSSAISYNLPAQIYQVRGNSFLPYDSPITQTCDHDYTHNLRSLIPEIPPTKYSRHGYFVQGFIPVCTWEIWRWQTGKLRICLTTSWRVRSPDRYRGWKIWHSWRRVECLQHILRASWKTVRKSLVDKGNEPHPQQKSSCKRGRLGFPMKK